MALTLSNITQYVQNSRRVVEADVAFDNAYTTGGLTVPLASLGLKEVRRADIVFQRGGAEYGIATPNAVTTHGRQVVPDLSAPQTPKLKVYTANNTEAGAATDQTQVTTRVAFHGS